MKWCQPNQIGILIQDDDKDFSHQHIYNRCILRYFLWRPCEITLPRGWPFVTNWLWLELKRENKSHKLYDMNISSISILQHPFVESFRWKRNNMPKIELLGISWGLNAFSSNTAQETKSLCWCEWHVRVKSMMFGWLNGIGLRERLDDFLVTFSNWNELDREGCFYCWLD